MNGFLASALLLLSALTNADIVKLSKAGLSPETIEGKITASETSFDTSTDALVALRNEGVADSVIRAMILRTPAPPAPAAPAAPAPPAPATRPAAPPPASPAAAPKAFTRRYDVAILTPSGTRCEGAEVKIDGRAVAATRCHKLDFRILLTDLKGVCYEYGFRGTVAFTTAGGEHRLSTVTPAEAKRIVDHLRVNVPAVPVAECRR